MGSRQDIINALIRLNLVSNAEPLKLTELGGGISSEIYRVDTSSKSICVKRALPTLKSDRHWHVPVERSEAEWNWLNVANDIIPDIAPKPLGYDDQSNLVVMAYLDPKTFRNWKDLLRTGKIDPVIAGDVARNLVTIHNSTTNKPDFARQFANDEVFYKIRLEAYFLAAGRSVPEVNNHMVQLVADTAAQKYALVHGDVSPKNILVGPEGPVFIDSECAWYGEPAFDAAFCLTHFLLKCAWQPQWKSQYLACHKAFRQTYLDHVKWQEHEEMDRRITRLHLGMLLARVAGRSKVEYITELPEIEMIRKFAVRLLRHEIATTAEVAELWEKEWHVT
ncbi:MAG: aminoglycoside phosphotransferase family protein [Rhodospirillales bacterium]|nr:aminoglycoside phosphotransferase family protein [Rhodospirillales bacterium]